MESHFNQNLAYEALMMQLAEGVDEWILDAPIVRFGLLDAKPTPPVVTPNAVVKEIPLQLEANFDECANIPDVLSHLKSVLPPALLRSAMNDLEIYGDEDADIAIIIDPPHMFADQQGDLSADPAIKLLLKSFAAIDLAPNANGGKEPRARIAILPISPWRVAQDRKLMDKEAEIFRNSLIRRLELRNFRAVILAGNNIAQVDQNLDENRFAGLDVYSVVSPAMMLREPLLKRRHWQMLLALHIKLDEIIKI